MRFNSPPGWPQPPEGWTPPPGWRPDPSWPEPPLGWRMWVDDDERTVPSFAPQRSTTVPWYRRTRYVTLLLIFFFPVGLALLWLRGDWSVRRRGLISGVTAVWAIILIAGTTSTPPTTVALSPAAGQNSSSPIATAATAATAGTPSRSPSAAPSPSASPSAVKPSPSKAAPSTTHATHAATHAATHTATTQAAVQKPTCGAPKNPYGYNFCGTGGQISNPASDVCDYFNCIASFWNGSGYMVECNDGDYSMSGGIRGACSDHQGVERTVYSG